MRTFPSTAQYLQGRLIELHWVTDNDTVMSDDGESDE
jgi:hypothetical protein